MSGSDSLNVIFSEPAAFVSVRPEWTVTGALLRTPDGRTARLTQTPFAWSAGAWETAVTIIPIEASGGMETRQIDVRVTPDTLRRWADVGINPFLEACAQLEEFWRAAKSRSVTDLTWL